MNDVVYPVGSLVIDVRSADQGFGVVTDVRGEMRFVDWVGRRHLTSVGAVPAERLMLARCGRCDDGHRAVAYVEFDQGQRRAFCPEHADRCAVYGLTATYPGRAS